MKFINIEKAQTAVEFLLLFAAVILVLVFAFAPRGFITNSINSAMEDSIDGIKNMADGVCYDSDGNPC